MTHLGVEKRWISRVVQGALVCVLMTACSAYAAQGMDYGVRQQLFKSGQYGDYLQHLDEEFANRTPQQLDLSLQSIVAVAVALDKTKQWESEVGKKAEAVLSSSPDALRYFQATKRLLAADIAGISLFFEGTPPNYGTWRGRSEELRSHGYPLAADAFAAVYMTGSTGLGTPHTGGPVEAGVKALASVSPEQREVLLKLVCQRLEDTDNWNGKDQVASTAIRLCRRLDSESATGYLDIAARMGASSDLLLKAARDFESLQQRNLAARAAIKAWEAGPTSAEQQSQIGRLIGKYADDDTALSFFNDTLAKAAEPQVRDIRMLYLRWLKEKGNAQELDAALSRLGPVGKADGKLLTGDRGAAAQAYAAVVRNQALAPEQRLDALIGWLSVAPDVSVDEAKGLVAQAKAKVTDKVILGATLRWMGWSIWRAMEPNANEPDASRRQRAVKASAIMESLVASDPEECLHGERSLRVPAAALYALAQHPEKSVEVLNQRVTYQVPAPAGGWRNAPGAPTTPKSNQPRTVTSPSAGQPARWAQSVIVVLTNSGADTTTVEAAKHALSSIPGANLR